MPISQIHKIAGSSLYIADAISTKRYISIRIKEYFTSANNMV